MLVPSRKLILLWKSCFFNDCLTTTTAQKIYRVKVFGVAGNVLKQFVYPAGSNAVSLDLSDLANGTYIIQAYDNYSWTSQQVVILK